MDIFEQIKFDIEFVASKLIKDKNEWKSYIVEFPKNPLNGDIYTNIALVIKSKTNKSISEIAFFFKQELEKYDYIAHIEIAGRGFINFTIKAFKWQEYLNYILEDKENFWAPNIGNQAKVNIEYVSANPTGPLHIGHTRCAIYGDILSNIFKIAGYVVTKEYYINDAGSQIDKLIETVFLRCKEILTSQTIQIKNDMYPGEYIKEIAHELIKIYQNKLLVSEEKDLRNKVKNFTIAYVMSIIKKDLALLNIKHDVFTSEKHLQDNGIIDKAIALAEKKNCFYYGIIDLPKGKSSKDLIQKEQMLFKSSQFGDAQDRPIKKQDGSWTYLASDFAYAKDKIDRGFDILIYVLGADHKGYIERIKAVVKVLSQNKVKSVVKTNELVNFVTNDKNFKMSKRSGNIITIKDVLDKVGLNALRFMMVSRKNDLEMDFDFTKVVAQSKDNPIFYIQYAYVRILSIMKRAKKQCPEALKLFYNKEFDLSLLSNEEEIQIIKLLATWPKLIVSILKSFEPHRIANYTLEIASKFHSLWNMGKLGQSKNNYLFIITDNPKLTASRLAFAESIRKVILKSFELIGIQALEEM
ncbi:MAG: arginine--tRNA ligase [Rickettsia sp.]|nr:arginine--tRNA ligase [Rickettsia sp.]